MTTRPAAASLPAPAGRERSLLLVNGQRVTMATGPDGKLSAAVLQPSGLDFSLLLRLTFCGQVALVPAAALPFFGHGLDPSLFMVSSLRREENGGRLPVRLSWAAGAGHPRLPGVHITRAGRGTAEGYLTAASARAFGAALIRQYRADHARASYGADGIFSGALSIRLAGSAAPVRPARPRFPQHTLTVRATNLAGRPDNGDQVTVFNADNCERFGDPIETTNVFRHGTAKFSVPAGHYWAIGDFLNFAAFPLVDRIVILPQFTVASAATVTMAERSATSPVTFSTPRPSVPQMISFSLLRTSGPAGSGPAAGLAWAAFNARLLISPVTTPPTVGGLLSFTSAELTSPRGAAPPYAYNLDYPAPPGLVPAQHFDVSPASLATVGERYFQDTPSRGEWSTVGGTQAQSEAGIFGQDLPIPLPGQQTQYFTGGPALAWATAYAEFASNSSPDTGGGQTGAFQTLAAGQSSVQDWNRYPLHPGAAQVLSPSVPLFVTIPAAARAGNLLVLNPVPFSDSTPGHTGSGFANGPRTRATGQFAVAENGRQVKSGPATGSLIRIPVHGSSLVRFTLTASRRGKAYPLSPASRTTWTWRTRPDPQARVPASWLCAARHGDGLVPTRQCAVQPMMTLGYQVDGLGLAGTAPAGPQHIDLTAGHLQLAPAPAVTGAAAVVSFDGGRHWQRATVTGQGGQFSAAFTAPPGALVTLRVTATDAAGGSVAETIQRAYRTGPGAAGHTAVLTARRLGTGRPRSGRGGLMAAPPCARARSGRAQCDLLYRPQTRAREAARETRPHGWGARAIEAAYRLPVNRHSHQTVAVSIAFRIPHLARDLAKYRRHYGLPPCTMASGCLRVVNQRGRPSPLPQSGKGTGWDLEGTLDVSMISAACPLCRILVVEGNDDQVNHLGRTDVTAARLGAQVISNSYGTRENGFALTLRHQYVRPGHTVVASTGDIGFTAASFPADLSDVVAVGGTELSRAENARGWAERVWSDPANFGAASSGCSAYVGKPPWQHDAHCPGRTVADVSAVADRVAIFEPDYGGWVTVAGTSIAAPLISGVFGLAGDSGGIGPRHLYAHARDLFDVTAGSNSLFGPPAEVCGDDYLCTAKPGYDGPTGLGTPDGTGAF